MFSLSFDRFHNVLCLTFTGPFTTEDLEAIDPTLIQFLGDSHERSQQVRCLFDMRQVECLAVSQSRFRVRAGKSAIGDMSRVVVAPPWAGSDFGLSYREGSAVWMHAQPIIVLGLEEAYRRLEIVEACFEAIEPSGDPRGSGRT